MKTINYGLIVSDYDGTLVGSDGTVSEKNKQAISDYIEAGGIFAISTGRLPPAILPQARRLGLKGPVSCGQGTVIVDIESEEILFQKRLSFETTLAACRKMEEMGVHILVFDLWECYSNQDNEMLAYYERVAGVKAIRVKERSMSSLIEEKKLMAYKLIALVYPEQNQEVQTSLKEAHLPDCDITKSMDFLVEVVNPTQSKGTALLFLAEKYGIPKEKTVGIGDNLNDASMIEAAGLGVAVGNAEADLKKKADYVCKETNNESAVAGVIETFGFSQDDK